ncbi:MAG: PQQ-binding-like beta-propeller repeat protein [Planctomycetota bacterium]|nr:PQQ-binding-like beta-propeller repeat protein [Planctomycetota bacterium]
MSLAPLARVLALLLLFGATFSLIIPSRIADGSWPKFQGPDTPGQIPASLPLTWASREDMAWTTILPGYGQSSPVIWGDMIVLTSIEGPEKETGIVVCLDKQTGKVKWKKEIQTASGAKNNNYVSRAAPTPIIDADRITVLFEGGNLLSLDHQGNIVWQRNLVDDFGEIKARHGLSASLEQNQDTVFVWIERENEPYVLAVAKTDGTDRWKVPGLGVTSWSSPRLVPVAEQAHLVLSGVGKLVGFDPKSGERLWEIDDISGNSTPTPVPVGDGRFLIGATTGRSGGGAGKAARSNGLVKIERSESGEFKADFLWRCKRATSSFGSPLAHEGLAYFVNRQGVIYCIRLADGEEQFAERTADSVWATPFAAGERLYFFGKKGTTTVIKAGNVFEQLAVNELATDAEEGESATEAPARGGRVLYAAAVDDGAIFLRTGNRLFCIR